MTDAPTSQPGIDIGRYWVVLVSRWQTVVAGTLLGILVAGAYLLIVPPTFVSTTTLTVLPITSDPYASNRNNNNLIDMNSEATTARSFKVAELAAGSIPDEWNAVDLRDATTVSAGGDSSTMTISVSAESEQKARAGAGAMAEAYIKMRSEQARSGIEAATQRDQERISTLRQSLNSAIKRLAAAKPGSPAAAEASADQQIINLQISTLLNRARSLEGVDTTGGVILNPASLTQVTRKPARVTTLATGLAGGLLLGIVTAFVTHSRRKVVHSRHDLQREFEIETLGVMDDTTQGMAAVAQRLLRLTTRQRARAVALVFDKATAGHLVLAEHLVDELRDAGTSVTFLQTPAPDEISSSEDLVLVPVGGDTSLAARLQALRLCDATVLVVGIGATRMKDLATVVSEASEMGSEVIGAAMLAHPRDPAPSASSVETNSRSE